MDKHFPDPLNQKQKNSSADKEAKGPLASEPIENHTTAAWADIETVRPESLIGIPGLFETINAKEWVDDNQK